MHMYKRPAARTGRRAAASGGARRRTRWRNLISSSQTRLKMQFAREQSRRHEGHGYDTGTGDEGDEGDE
jgi:hypothetical protein